LLKNFQGALLQSGHPINKKSILNIMAQINLSTISWTILNTHFAYHIYIELQVVINDKVERFELREQTIVTSHLFAFKEIY
jgi:hypothetical protein